MQSGMCRHHVAAPSFAVQAKRIAALVSCRDCLGDDARQFCFAASEEKTVELRFSENKIPLMFLATALAEALSMRTGYSAAAVADPNMEAGPVILSGVSCKHSLTHCGPRC
eukprot:5543640-Amphidinium_carterae.1